MIPKLGMTIAAARQLVSRGMGGFAIELLGHGSFVNKLREVFSVFLGEAASFLRFIAGLLVKVTAAKFSRETAKKVRGGRVGAVKLTDTIQTVPD